MVVAGQLQRAALPSALPRPHRSRPAAGRGQARAVASRASIIARPDRQRALVHAPRSLGRRERLGVVCKAGGEVLVAGATGQQAARIALALAKSGYKVTAGVDDVAVAQEAIAFARKVELLLPKEAEAVRAVELDLSNPETLDAALPRRGARVVLVAGDVQENRRADPKAVERCIALLAQAGNRVAQLVLVTPLGGPVGTGIFGFGTAKPRPDSLSKLEQQVIDSGLNYLIVRTGATDRVPDSYGEEANPVVASFGTLPPGLSVARSQVAEAVAEALSAARGDAIIEVGADPAALPVPVADQVLQIMADAAAAAAAQRKEQSVDEEEKPATAAGIGLFKTVSKAPAKRAASPEPPAVEEKKPAARSGGLFAAPQRKKAAPVEEEKEEAKPVATRRAGLFAAPQRKAAPAAEEKEEAKPAATRSGGLFGTRAQRRPEPAAEPEEKKPVTRSGGLFGTRSARTAAAAAEPAKTVAGTRGTRGTSSTTTRGAAAATTTRRQASPAPVPEQPKRVVRGRKPIAAEEAQAKPAPRTTGRQQAAKPAEAEKPKKKSGGFLQALGIGQETIYADE